MKILMRIILFILCIFLFICCGSKADEPLSGLYFYPESCINENNNLTSKEKRNCITVEFPENENRLILSELDSQKKPNILEYFVTKTETKSIVKVKFNGSNELVTLFEIDENNNLKCIYKGLVGTEVEWVKK
tara:strand:- start:308 stop:703 length:396 start_codon:yes stop_codon:yes gene_type:complete